MRMRLERPHPQRRAHVVTRGALIRRTPVKTADCVLRRAPREAPQDSQQPHAESSWDQIARPERDKRVRCGSASSRVEQRKDLARWRCPPEHHVNQLRSSVAKRDEARSRTRIEHQKTRKTSLSATRARRARVFTNTYSSPPHAPCLNTSCPDQIAIVGFELRGIRADAVATARACRGPQGAVWRAGSLSCTT